MDSHNCSFLHAICANTPDQVLQMNSGRRLDHGPRTLSGRIFFKEKGPVSPTNARVSTLFGKVVKVYDIER